MEYKLRGETLRLLSEKAIYWPKEKCLLVSDVHQGKIQHFRKFGLGVPNEAAKSNIHRLSQIFDSYEISKVIFLGDLFHSSLNSEWQSFSKFRKGYKNIEFDLVMGNHDILDEHSFSQAIDNILPEGTCLGPFALFHHPSDKEGYYGLCGHIHPSLKIVNHSKQSVRVPCFYFGESFAILPAFGSFTGTHSIQAKKNDDIFLIVEDEVIQY